MPGESEIRDLKSFFHLSSEDPAFHKLFLSKNFTLNFTKTFKAEAGLGANEMKRAKQIYSPRIEINSVT